MSKSLKVTFKDEANMTQSPFRVKMHVAAQDAINVSKFSADKIQAGEDLRKMVAQAYDMSRVFRNYRAKFIAVKVDAPKFTNKASEAAELIDKLCAEKGYEKVFQGENIIFRIPV